MAECGGGMGQRAGAEGKEERAGGRGQGYRVGMRGQGAEGRGQKAGARSSQNQIFLYTVVLPLGKLLTYSTKTPFLV